MRTSKFDRHRRKIDSMLPLMPELCNFSLYYPGSIDNKNRLSHQQITSADRKSVFFIS